jgi:hypothetical protein
MTRVLSIDIGRVHYGVCAIELGGVPNLMDLRVVSFGEGTVVSTATLVDRMVSFWTTHAIEGVPVLAWGPVTVLIEQQVTSSPVNIALAFATMAFFRAHGVPVRFVRAMDKFLAWKRYWPDECSIPATVPSSYAKRKRHAVLTAGVILQTLGLPPLATYPGCADKVDDAADAFLQSFCGME